MSKFLSSIDADGLPNPFDTDRMALGLDRFEKLAEGNPELEACQDLLASDPSAGALARAIFGNSPYLSQCVLHEPLTFRDLIMRGPNTVFDAIIVSLRDKRPDQMPVEALMSGLRRAKSQAALAIAIADICNVWPLEQVTRCLSDFATIALDLATAAVLLDTAKSGVIELADPATPCAGSGFAILGMGKLGARELNYSSDIDLIVLYDLERMIVKDWDRVRHAFVRATRLLIKIMEERTSEGYVLRTDLRLRPDPGATPPAVSLDAALTYYESMGQNWERAAMIKARPVAGDTTLGREFLRMIRPFVWRRNLDFAAIQDIHSIKRQIAAHRGGTKISVEGHDVKVGRGGIREIELYAQTQQLIWGGKQPSLRQRGTIETLQELSRLNHVDEVAADELGEAYEFLRRVEHRLQMVDDKQTQQIPDTTDGVDHIAAFLGEPDGAVFGAKLTGVLSTVDRHFAQLFPDERPLGGGRALVFTGSDDHPDTIETLEDLGFEDASRVATLIRAWHAGRHRSTRSERARQILTELMPRLLEAFGKTANPDEAFVRFDAFLGGLPAGVQMFSLFQSNPPLLDLVAQIMGDAPRLSQLLSRKPSLLESVLTEAPLELMSDNDALRAELDQALEHADDYQDVLDFTRRWASDHKFQVGLQIMRGLSSGADTGPWLSNVADAVICALAREVERGFAETHGHIPGGGLIILAFGKLGGREMMPGSDLDLVFLYERAAGAEQSDGEKPLGPSVYYNRLVQRIVTALTTLTPEGTLYEVDMRLRPAGEASPAALRLETFRKYYREDAWTWELMALTRARPVYGPHKMMLKAGRIVETFLSRKRDPQQLYANIADMRRRVEKQFPGTSPWAIKHRRGGLMDVEFIAQTLALEHGHKHPKLASTNTAQMLDNLRHAGVLEDDIHADLSAALRLWHRVQALLRLTVEGGFQEAEAPEGLKRVLAAAGEVDHFEELVPKMDAAAETVRGLYARLIDEPAARAEEKQSGEAPPAPGPA